MINRQSHWVEREEADLEKGWGYMYQGRERKIRTSSLKTWDSDVEMVSVKEQGHWLKKCRDSNPGSCTVWQSESRTPWREPGWRRHFSHRTSFLNQLLRLSVSCVFPNTTVQERPGLYQTEQNAETACPSGSAHWRQRGNRIPQQQWFTQDLLMWP